MCLDKGLALVFMNCLCLLWEVGQFPQVQVKHLDLEIFRRICWMIIWVWYGFDFPVGKDMSELEGVVQAYQGNVIGTHLFPV